MNLLVTNTRNAQAYAIIRALRPHATKIVATMEGENRLAARLSHAANSRLVDKRYYTPSPAKDWRAGRIQKENTQSEEAYIRAILRICEKESIDTIFPSFDPHVYVFSKNKQRFEKTGVLIPIPDYETVITSLDKYRTMQAAAQAGFPCPRTYLYERQEDLKGIVEREGFPLVIKPRCSSAGRGMAIVKDYHELLEKLPFVIKNHGNPIIQEYIPGRQRKTVDLLLDRNGQLKFAFQKKILRNFRVTTQLVTVSESILPDAHVLNSAKLAQKIGWWGSVSIGTIRDPRDGLSKLMEINPRSSQQLWHRTEIGLKEPWMCIKVARQEPIESVKDYPEGILFVSPIEDLQLLGLQLLDWLIYKFRVSVQRSVPADRLSLPMSIGQQIRSFMQTYLSRQKKILDPYFKYSFQDPLVSMIWWSQYFMSVLRGAKQLGR